MRSARLAAAMLSAASLAAAAGAAPAAGVTVSNGAGWAAAAHHIRHVIEIMLENHTVADLFPGGPGGSRRTHVTPAWAPRNEGDVQGGILNSRVAELFAMDYRPGSGYLMDRYTQAPYGVQAITAFGSWADPNLQYLAHSYEFADQNFQPVIGPTQPNIMTALNGTAHGWYYNRPDPRPARWNSIFDEMTRYHRSWKIYLAVPPAIFHGTQWYDLIPPGHQADIAPAGDFLSDLSRGHLPAFSFVRPGYGYSEEPREDIGEGDAWVGQLVGAVARSRYWRSTAIFITYDEGGGFWDPAAPAVASGYGTRTPMVIVSPWARTGVFPDRTTNVAILSFMQRLWRMPALTPLNARQNTLATAFGFHRRPLPPPGPPVAPPATIGFHGRTLASHVRAVYPHRPLRIYLDAETPGLSLDNGLNGPLTINVTAPAGTRKPAGFPVHTRLAAGRAMIRVRFPAPGYYRLAATGPDGSMGWLTAVILTPGEISARNTGLPRSTM